MTNTELLDAKIQAAGLTTEEIAKKIGLTRQGFFYKRISKREFKQSEIQAMTEILGLTFAEQTQIFFADCGD